LTDQKMVMCHVCGHVDFFKNNFVFRATDLDHRGQVVQSSRGQGPYDPNRKWIDKMANHGARLSRHIARHGIDKVEPFIDYCLSLENLIDPYDAFKARAPIQDAEEEDKPQEVPRLKAKGYMEKFINPDEYIDEQRKKLDAEKEKPKKHPEHPERDVLRFLLENAPLERWERDVLEVIREEAYYFVPQMQTKIMNEGWACLTADMRVVTDAGMLTMHDLVVRGAKSVTDGETERAIYARNIIEDREIVRIRTRRGLRVEGSTNHRVIAADGAWRQLDSLAVGDRVRVTGGQNVWAREEVHLGWQEPEQVTLHDVAMAAGASLHTVLRHRAGRNTRSADSISRELGVYDDHMRRFGRRLVERRRTVKIPDHVDAALGAFLGYMIGDGHISRVKSSFGLTTADQEALATFADLSYQLFGLYPTIKWDDGRYRVLLHSETVSEFLTDGLGLTHGPSAREKEVPEVIFRSPKNVVRDFLRAYFDCDGYAGKQGVILSTSSEKLSEQVQLLLMNFGILSRRRPHEDGCWHVHVAGRSVQTFAIEVGFGLQRKKEQVERYLIERRWFKEESWDDEVVSIERGRADVYDISVEETHRYVAQGFVNHNSYWHSKLMTTKVATAAEILDYADRNAGVMATSPGRLNPYKLGVELYRDIEERWNRGMFGKDWEECDDLEAKNHWDLRLGLGFKKILEVRSYYNDVTFLDEFLTPDFCRRHKLFSFGYNNRNERFEIESREFKQVKEKILFQLTNFGNPFIYVEDSNFENRGELLLRHDHQGMDLRVDYAREVMQALVRVWKRPVNVQTKQEDKVVMLRFDGKEHTSKQVR
jgi:stage V sporulation protein R